MAHNIRVWSPPLVFNQVITETELNALDVFTSESVNGDQGGTWAPVTPIVFGGAGLDVSGPFSANDATAITINATGTLSAPAGALISVLGNAVFGAGAIALWQSGAFLTVNIGATFTMGGTMNASGTINANGILNMAGTPRVTGATSLGISPARVYQRARVSILEIDTGTWQRSTPESESWPLVALQAAFTTGLVPEQIGYDVDVADGATITSVNVAVKGGGAAHTPANPPIVRLHKIELATGVQTLIGSQTDTAVGAAYVVNHDITISGLSEVADRTTYQYVVRIQGEGAASGVLGLRVCAPRVFTTRAKVGEE